MNTDEQLESFARAVSESPHNLMSRAAIGELATRHIPECVAIAQFLPAGIRHLIDIGSGGGFPGIVIAIMRPDITVHLVESVGKKAQFLAEVGRTLKLNAIVHHMRVEEYARQSNRPVPEAVTARAVASVKDLAILAAPLLPPGGFLYAIKGERWKDELQDARETLARVKLRVDAEPDDSYTPELGQLPRIITLQKR